MVRADVKGEALQALGAMFAAQRESPAQSTAPPPPAAEPKNGSAEPGIKPPTNKPTPRRRSRRRGR